MSAIFGIIDFEGRPIDPEWIKSMQRDLAHRGPDGQGLYQEESMFMGHMLLQVTPESIYDKSPYEEDGLVITAHARLDEREAIMDRLDIPDSEREIIVDALLLLRSFKKFGKDFVKDIYGDFAFAIWDKEKKELFCARDQMGVKPFLYYFEDNKLVFSTEIRSLVKLEIVKTEVDHIHIRNSIFIDKTKPKQTTWENIFRLEAAHYLTINKNSFLLKKYWNPKYQPKKEYRDEKKATEEFKTLLFKAVSDRMRCIGDIMIPLSGGVDSSSIACIASKIDQKTLKNLFTISSILDPNNNPQELQDEMDYISAVLDQEKKLKPIFIKHTDLSFSKNILEVLERHYDLVNYFFYIDEEIFMKTKEKSIRRVISGYLGDLTVSNYINPLPHLFLEGRFYTLFNMLKKIKPFSHLAYFNLFKNQVLEPIFPLFIRIWWKKLRGENPLAEIDEGFFKLTEFEKEELQKTSEENIKEYLRFKKNIAEELIPKNWDAFQEDWDCGSSHYELEFTYPLADRRIIEFMLELPIEHFKADGLKRGLIRKAMTKVIPEKVRSRKNKHPYSPGHKSIMIKELNVFLTDSETLKEKKIGEIIILFPELVNFKNYLVYGKNQKITSTYFKIKHLLIINYFYSFLTKYYENPLDKT